MPNCDVKQQLGMLAPFSFVVNQHSPNLHVTKNQNQNQTRIHGSLRAQSPRNAAFVAFWSRSLKVLFVLS